MVGLHPPKDGFSQGTKQGLRVALPLLIVLVAIPLFVEVRADSALAVSLNVLASVLVAIVAVWVVGGLFELEGKYRDVGIKAAGGVAVLVFMLAWVEPFGNLRSFAPNAINVSLPGNTSIRFLYEELQAANGTSLAPVVVRFDGDRATILSLRPKPVDATLSYGGANWLEIFARVASQVHCLSASGSPTEITLKLDAAQTEMAGDLVLCKE